MLHSAHFWITRSRQPLNILFKGLKHYMNHGRITLQVIFFYGIEYEFI